MDISYTRVTQVLSFFSGLDKIHPDVLKNAANRGTCVHRICDYIVNKEIYNLDDEVKKYTVNEDGIVNETHFAFEKPQVENLVNSFQIWCKDKDFFPKPKRFYDSTLMITGECDLIYRDDCGLVLVDLKTPANESSTWLLQGSAYSHLANLCGHNIQRIEFVKLDKAGKAPKIFTYKEDFQLFKCFLAAYRYMKDKLDNVSDYL